MPDPVTPKADAPATISNKDLADLRDKVNTLWTQRVEDQQRMNEIELSLKNANLPAGGPSLGSAGVTSGGAAYMPPYTPPTS